LSPNFDSVDNPYDDIGKTYGVVLLYQINCYLQQLRYSCYRRVERVGQDHIYGLGWGYAGGVGANDGAKREERKYIQKQIIGLYTLF